MITIIAGTDRQDSNTLRVAEAYAEQFDIQKADHKLYALSSLPADFFTEGRYGTPPPSFEQVLNKQIRPAEKFLFVVPEYNGSFPGVLKFFLDIVHPETWAGKKTALAGVASGRAGNLRGLDHLTGVMHYLKAEVLHQKPLYSSIHLHLNGEGKCVNEEYNILMKTHAEALIKF